MYNPFKESPARIDEYMKFVNLILLPYRKSIYFQKHKLTDFILFDISKQIVFYGQSYKKFLSNLLIVAINWLQKCNF